MSDHVLCSDFFVDQMGGELAIWGLPERKFYDQLFEYIVEWCREQTAQRADLETTRAGEAADQCGALGLDLAFGDVCHREWLRDAAVQHAMALHAAGVIEYISRAFARAAPALLGGRMPTSHLRWSCSAGDCKLFDARYFVKLKQNGALEAEKEHRKGLVQLVQALGGDASGLADLAAFVEATFTFRDPAAHNSLGFLGIGGAFGAPDCDAAPSAKQKRDIEKDEALEKWLDRKSEPIWLTARYQSEVTAMIEQFAKTLRISLCRAVRTRADR